MRVIFFKLNGYLKTHYLYPMDTYYHLMDIFGYNKLDAVNTRNVKNKWYCITDGNAGKLMLDCFLRKKVLGVGRVIGIGSGIEVSKKLFLYIIGITPL